MSEDYRPEESAMNTEQRIKNLIADQLCVDIERVQNNSSLTDDLGADELDVIELVMSLEEEFGRCITEDEAENIKTVQDVIDLMRSKGIYD